MRILAFFLRLFVFSLIIGVFVYFFGGTIWLKIGTNSLIQDLTKLTLYNKNLSIYEAKCRTAPQSSENSNPLSFQIRFLDNTHYIVEVVCTLIEDQPLEIKRGSLPPLITKLPGSAGFTAVVDQNLVSSSAVRFTSLGKELGIELSGDTITSGANIQALVGSYPKAECSSYGYKCCTDGSQGGMGDLLSQKALDCPMRCFAACSDLPFVALFNSDPPYDQDQRQIIMSSTTLDVIFNYGVMPKTVKNVHIDFGDGQTQDSTLADGIFTHTYTCNQACKYAVALSATDVSGNQSVVTSQSNIYIIKK